MIDRDQALGLVRKRIKTENTVKHMLATEAIMRALAKKLEPDKVDVWGLTGLIHDLDLEEMKDPTEHGLKTFEILSAEKLELPEEVAQAVKAHNYDKSGAQAPQTLMDWSLFISDTLTGLIVATALVRPDRKLSSVKVKSVMKKFKNKAFAAGTRRDEIAMCEDKLKIELRDFVSLSLSAMQEISDDLGL